MTVLTLTEIAARITAHLKRFEADKQINRPNPKRYNTTPFYRASAYQAGAYVRVVYVAYQNGTSLKRAEASDYLEWLDAGNVGKHTQALEAKP